MHSNRSVARLGHSTPQRDWQYLLRAAIAALLLDSCVGSDVPTPQKMLEGPVAPPSIVVPGLEEPVVSTKPTQSEEDQALKQAAKDFHALGGKVDDEDALEPFREFVATHPDSGWNASVLTNLGLATYRHGYFSRAFRDLDAAWRAGRP